MELRESLEDLIQECVFQASRSSGPGGQNVNKVNSRVELRFHIPNSQCLNGEEKERILNKLANRINSVGELVLSSQSERTQLANKNKVTGNFLILIEEALKVPKARKRTRPSRAVNEKRLQLKKERSNKKTQRKKPDL